MKLKVYNIAAMALALITLGTKSFAQGSASSSTSSSSTTPATATAPAAAKSINGVQVYTVPSNAVSVNGYAIATAPSNFSLYNQAYDNYAVASTNGVYLNSFGVPQDSTYLKKMKKLQEQMGSLQKEMSALRTDEYKRQAAEREKALAERVKDADRKFASRFAPATFTTRYNYERNDADLEKKVESGEVKLKTKSYTKSYAVDAGDKLKINNQFGKVTINSWNKNEIKVDVEIKAYANDDDKASELLGLISIEDSKNSEGVSFATKIEQDRKNNFWGTMTSNGKTTIRKTVINYTVYMPSKNALTIDNKFGAVVLPDMGGRVVLNNEFGNLFAKTLTNTNNVINLKHGDATIESLTGSDLNMQFGTLSLQSADKLNADLQHTPAKFGKLSNSANIKVYFGEGIQIATLDKNLKTLQINSSYAPIKLISLKDDNADFNVTTSFGGFTYDNDRVDVTSKSPADDERSYSSTKTYKGKIGKGDSDKQITIKSTFSSVKFDQ